MFHRLERNKWSVLHYYWLQNGVCNTNIVLKFTTAPVTVVYTCIALINSYTSFRIAGVIFHIIGLFLIIFSRNTPHCKKIWPLSENPEGKIDVFWQFHGSKHQCLGQIEPQLNVQLNWFFVVKMFANMPQNQKHPEIELRIYSKKN